MAAHRGIYRSLRRERGPDAKGLDAHYPERSMEFNSFFVSFVCFCKRGWFGCGERKKESRKLLKTGSPRMHQESRGPEGFGAEYRTARRMRKRVLGELT